MKSIQNKRNIFIVSQWINLLSILSEKKDEVRRCREKLESSVVEYDEEEFEKV